jgi:hypothetical protein
MICRPWSLLFHIVPISAFKSKLTCVSFIISEDSDLEILILDSSWAWDGLVRLPPDILSLFCKFGQIAPLAMNRHLLVPLHRVKYSPI